MLSAPPGLLLLLLSYVFPTVSPFSHPLGETFVLNPIDWA